MSAPEPTIRELIQIAGSATRGSLDKTSDFITGSDYDVFAGPAAIIWSREAARDTDIFNDVNFNTADGDALTVLVRKRFGKERILDTRGSGSATLSRTSSGVADTVWKGTRISIIGSTPKTYRVTKNVDASSVALTVDVPIEAVDIGPGSAADVSGVGNLRLEDSLQDPSWIPSRLTCTDGTFFEKADVFRARVKKERFDERVGQTKSIITTCQNAGAANVMLFRSDYAGDAYDFGLNVCYVGDLGYSGTPDLVKACTLALRKTRVAGDHLQVLPMTKMLLDIDADVYLNDSPPLFDLTRLERIQVSSVLQYLNGGSGRYTFSLDGIRAAIARPTSVQRVVLTTPTSDGTVVIGALKAFPSTLNRYVANRVTLRYHGPG